MLKDSIAIINNPQIYCEKLPIQYNKLINTCFSEESTLEKLESEYRHLFNVVDYIKKKEYFPKIIYIINNWFRDRFK